MNSKPQFPDDDSFFELSVLTLGPLTESDAISLVRARNFGKLLLISFSPRALGRGCRQQFIEKFGTVYSPTADCVSGGTNWMSHDCAMSPWQVDPGNARRTANRIRRPHLGLG